MQICMGGVLLPSIDLVLRDCRFKTLKLPFGPVFKYYYFMAIFYFSLPLSPVRTFKDNFDIEFILSNDYHSSTFPGAKLIC